MEGKRCLRLEERGGLERFQEWWARRAWISERSLEQGVECLRRERF